MVITAAPASVIDQLLSPSSKANYNLNPYALTLYFPSLDSWQYHSGGYGSNSRNIISAAPTPARSTSSVSGVEETDAGPLGRGKMPNLLALGPARSLDGIFRYVTSKWALACFALAIVLNRTQVFASPRRNVRVSWLSRVLLRLLPLYFLSSNAFSLLHAIRCQTSPDYSELNHWRMKRQGELNFSGDGGIMYHLSSRVLFWEDDSHACRVVDMIPSVTWGIGWIEHGSLSLLWPLFQSLCLSQFVEILIGAIQGQRPMTETGMSIFEHSLAFFEAEGLLSNLSGLSPSFSSHVDGARRPEKDASLISRPALLQQMNTPPEYLLLGLTSAFNSLSSHLLGVFDLQNRYRLVNTSIWGLCYMALFLWGFFSLRPESGPERVILRFPSVCIVGFIPHLIVMAGILVCCVIYFLALTVCVLSPPERVADSNLWERVRWAKDNLQVSDRLSNILPLDMHQDFFSSLIRTGFAILTAASEAVYLLEYKSIGVPRWTWLEEERMKQLDCSTDSTRQRSIHVEPHAQSCGFSGYGNAVNPSPNETGPEHEEDGVGQLQRGIRYIRAYKYLKCIFWLYVESLKIFFAKIWVGAGFRPLSPLSKKPESHQSSPKPHDNESKDTDSLVFWMISEDGVLSRPKSRDVDVEQETRIRMRLSNPIAPSEEQISSRLYDWWRRDGWWGELDSSGSYTASTQDDEDDTTSLISMSTTAETSDESSWQSDPNSGRSTPTQDRPKPRRPRSPSPLFDHGLDAAHLASLLNPKDLDDRQQAKILAHTLTAPGITTRSRYQRATIQEKTNLLTSPRTTKHSGSFAQEEEAELLEAIINIRRSEAARDRSRQDSESWASGGAACVVCQCSPRSVLVWPCRCLIICEDCRTSLAMNNYSTCVCCRRDVYGYSRLYVP